MSKPTDLTPQTTKRATLRKALKDLLDADRAALGSDNVCIYCDEVQNVNGHAEWCVVTQAEEALSDD